MVSRVLSLIPDRIAHVQSGTPFGAGTSPARHPERFAHLVQFLQWLSPLHSLASEDQQALGLLNAAGRPVHAIDLEGEEAQEDADALEEPELRDEETQDEPGIERAFQEQPAEALA